MRSLFIVLALVVGCGSGSTGSPPPVPELQIVVTGPTDPPEFQGVDAPVAVFELEFGFEVFALNDTGTAYDPVPFAALELRVTEVTNPFSTVFVFPGHVEVTESTSFVIHFAVGTARGFLNVTVM